MTSLKHFKDWERQKLAEFRGPKNEIIYCVVEWNSCYGELITRWEIDGRNKSDVNDKYLNKPLLFHCSNSLIGERPFLRDSIIFEFLYHELGLKFKESEIPCSGADGWQKHFSNFAFFKKCIEENGGKIIK